MKKGGKGPPFIIKFYPIEFMTAFIELDDLKAHLNIDKEYTDEDKYILDLWDAAVAAIERYIDHPIADYLEDGQLIPDLQHAAKLLVATWYMNRESVAYGSPQKVPHSLEFLLQTYIDYYHDKPNNCCCAQ